MEILEEQQKNDEYSAETSKVNSLIIKYRQTMDNSFKKEACDLLEDDLCRFFSSHFIKFYHLKDDIMQEMRLVLSNLINVNSPFDPSLGINIIFYAKQALLSAGRKYVDKMKTSIKYEPKKRVELLKEINSIQKDNPNFDLDACIRYYVTTKYKKLTKDKIEQKVLEKKSLLLAGEIAPSLDETIDESGTPMGNTIAAQDSDFTEKIELRYQVKQIAFVAKKMYEKKLLSDLQFQVFKAFALSVLKDEGLTNADLAKEMNKSRQNFDRALNEALRKIKKYCAKYYPDIF